MIEIKEYNETYVEQISTIIIRNLLEVNVKDYGAKKVQEMAKDFTVDKLKDTLKNRTKVFVALKDDEVVGTASIDLSWYNPDEYWILSVFVKPENHCEGIGKLLIKSIEKYAISSNFKKLIIPASITANEFYHKLGYNYKDNKKVLNSENLYLMEKTFQLNFRKIEKEDIITIDMGCKVNGYCSDMTRTFFVGKVPECIKPIYDLVLKNQMQVLESYKDGANTRQITKMVENDFKLNGYDLIHSIGHGVGLEIHEAPYISYRSEASLKENMIVTNEPGIYIPGKFGIRIEDTTQITKFGCINLTKSEKNYIII